MDQLIPQGSTIAKTIRHAARQNALSHALILSGSGDLAGAARYAAAAMLCRSETGKPCMHCTACRKVATDIHPDVRLVCDEEHKEMSVESVRELRRDVYIRPNEGERKVYIFPNCEQLNERDQNVLLKIVEEGPPHAAFIFCTAGSSDLLPTIRSRCVTWKMNGAENLTGNEQAEELCRCLAEGDPLRLTEWMTAQENGRMKREQAQEMFRCAWRIAAEALLLQCGKAAADTPIAVCAGFMSRHLGRSELQKLTDILKQYAGEYDYHVGVGHVLGAFAASCEPLLRRK
ncbi:MAG: DNA polymerase III subunit delta' [Eubacteriales bacterium]|nr:DNA polymerase III subunit delta' [Eubacteriales bacterium]